MIDKKAKDTFWGVVEDCLVEFHKLSKHDARQESLYLRTQIKSPPPGLSSEIFYHNDPFYVACDMMGNQFDLSQYYPKYDTILNQHNW
jgi:hypothetical protein